MKTRDHSRSSSFHHRKGLLAAAISLLFLHPASAHHGFDAHTSVRLLEKQSIVIVRMTPTVAAILMGADTPAGWTGDVPDDTRLKLEALGKRLFTLSTPAGALEPAEVRVSREVSANIAFVLTYPSVKAWPFKIDADFCKDFGPEFTGSIRIFGPPTGPTERQGAQLGFLELTRRERTLSLSDPAPLKP